MEEGTDDIILRTKKNMYNVFYLLIIRLSSAARLHAFSAEVVDGAA